MSTRCIGHHNWEGFKCTRCGMTMREYALSGQCSWRMVQDLKIAGLLREQESAIGIIQDTRNAHFIPTAPMGYLWTKHNWEPFIKSVPTEWAYSILGVEVASIRNTGRNNDSSMLS